ncbi:FtsX-like permease family protein [Actinomadura syzygii]|uniref:FtsX-like permease family protein n=1 Tax=Actinomadura syzygii TaxID=1427538 RepID=A0A5D0U249_9ACTN|nr:FtsX-like permease family protein [Actinomadura syzygii]
MARTLRGPGGRPPEGRDSVSGYLCALRMAARDAARSKGRTALVLAMIGFPTTLIVMLAVLMRTAEPTRTVVAGEGEPVSEGAAVAETAIGALVVTMIVLQVVLLAGPSFVVDVRRRRRDLALVAAAGGEARHLRAVVLAGGLVIGGVAALGGAALGIAGSALAKPVIEAVNDDKLGPFRVPWGLVVITMLVAAGSGVLAALVPARQAARMDVVSALAGRRDPPGRARRGLPLLGGLLVVAGIGISLVGVRVMREFGAALGAAAIIIGLVMVCPAVVGASGRVASRLPLPLRLAVRDAARNRARTAPAVAAITAAVAAVTALAIGGASDFRQREIEYRPELPMGTTLVRMPMERADEVGRAVRADLAGVPVQTLKVLPYEEGSCDRAATPGCPSVLVAGKDDDGMREILLDNVVGGPREARLLLGRDDPAVSAALTAGKVVMFRSRPPASGTTTMRIQYQDGQGKGRVIRDVPAVAAAGEPHVRTIIPPAVAARTGLPLHTEAYGVDRADHRVTKAEESRLKTTISRYTPESELVYVERGFTESLDGVLLLLAGVAAALVLGGALISTGLAAADARPDLATLAAVGARPRTRRVLTMAQAVVVAGIGCWLGIAGGLVPGFAVTRPLTEDLEASDGSVPAHGAILDVPWLLLIAIGVVVPLVAALAAGMFTAGRLPMTRRAAG